MGEIQASRRGFLGGLIATLAMSSAGVSLVIPPSAEAQTAGPGWLLCNGQAISRSEYPELFNMIGATFGSDSDTTFRVPEFNKRIYEFEGFGGGPYKFVYAINPKGIGVSPAGAICPFTVRAEAA